MIRPVERAPATNAANDAEDACAKFPGSPLCAADVARGATRMLLRHDLIAMTEVPLDGNRRADLMAIDLRGQIVIVEIKVSRADLLGDGKWTEYLACCDRYYWAVPAGFDLTPLDGGAFLPERTGIIVADRYDAAVVREAHTTPLAAATRKRATLAFGRRAAPIDRYHRPRSRFDRISDAQECSTWSIQSFGPEIAFWTFFGVASIICPMLGERLSCCAYSRAEKP